MGTGCAGCQRLVRKDRPANPILNRADIPRVPPRVAGGASAVHPATTAEEIGGPQVTHLCCELSGLGPSDQPERAFVDGVVHDLAARIP